MLTLACELPSPFSPAVSIARAVAFTTTVSVDCFTTTSISSVPVNRDVARSGATAIRKQQAQRPSEGKVWLHVRPERRTRQRKEKPS
jgi:hypothetical protein